MKAKTLKENQGGESHGVSNVIPVEEVLKRINTEGRILWYESQSGLTATVSAADLATYKAAFGEKGIAELAKKNGVTSRTLRRWHAVYKTGGLAAIMDKVERKDKGKTRIMCQLAQD